jgi:hypothetical protein
LSFENFRQSYHPLFPNAAGNFKVHPKLDRDIIQSLAKGKNDPSNDIKPGEENGVTYVSCVFVDRFSQT